MIMQTKPYAESCEQNRDAILQVIAPLLVHSHAVLEIGSGTGQHAVYFAPHMPHLLWQPSDCAEALPGIQLWLDEAALQNTRPALVLEVCQNTWPELTVDSVFSANTCHIMHWHMVEAMFAGVGRLLSEHGQLLLYGPFNYHGTYTSESNRRFDDWLKARDANSGVRDFAALDALANAAGLRLCTDYSMPANNRLLHWKKI